MRHGADDTYTLRLAADVYPNQPNVRRYQVALDAALFDDPRFDVSDIGPFVLAIRLPELMASSARGQLHQPRGGRDEPPDRAAHRHRRRAARRGTRDRHPAAAGQRRPPRELNWPQNGVLHSVDAPLIGYVATDLTITMPCQRGGRAGRTAERGKTVLLSTVPKQAPKAVDRGLLIERVNNDLLVIVRNTPVVSAPLDQVLSPACQQLTFTAHADKVTGEFVGLVKGPDSRRSRRTRCAASAAATTSGRRSSASSPIWPGPRRRACSSRPPSTPATAAPRRC